ncbi:hypothetical protein [Arthrobacter rhombi]|uniref:hypothetical protein n=1 Tax=Arthrobacter rhombi TaxID=71253 RepID=UPI003FD498CE
MTVQKLAADLCQRDLGRRIECTDPYDGKTATGTVTAMESGMHGVLLYLSGTIRSVRILPSAVVEVTGATPTIGPDCLHGKHPACDGRALDPATDDVVPCTCHCHTQEEPA